MAQVCDTMHRVREARDEGIDLRAFAEEHDLAIGEARQIIQQSASDRQKADKLAHRMKKW
jgi:hypothetical protein